MAVKTEICIYEDIRQDIFELSKIAYNVREKFYILKYHDDQMKCTTHEDILIY